MPRNVDYRCLACDIVENDIFTSPDTPRLCSQCQQPMQEVWWSLPAQRVTQWTERDSIVVFKKPDGSFAYPARNDRPTPPNCERVVLRSLRDVERHERVAGVRNESIWFDRSGRGFDTAEHTPQKTPRRDTFSE